MQLFHAHEMLHFIIAFSFSFSFNSCKLLYCIDFLFVFSFIKMADFDHIVINTEFIYQCQPAYSACFFLRVNCAVNATDTSPLRPFDLFPVLHKSTRLDEFTQVISNALFSCH